MASNTIAGTGDTFPNTANIDFGPASPPAGGINASSMIAGAKKPGLFSTANAMPRAGYVLGRAAQAIMGPYQNSPAALLGGVGAELSQQEAQRRTAARLLAGENLEDIEEASVLSPQQQQIVLGQAAERRKQKFEEATMETKLRFEAKKLGLDEKATNAYVDEKLASLGLIKKQTEGYESPAAARAANTAAQKELIGAEGAETRKTEEVRHANRMKELEKSIAGEISTIVKRGEIDEEQGKSLTKKYLGAAKILSRFIRDEDELNQAAKEMVNSMDIGEGKEPSFKGSLKKTGKRIRGKDGKWRNEDGVEIDPITGKPKSNVTTPRG